MKSAFGLQGQKCSACSRVYVHKKVYDAFIAKLSRRRRRSRMGDPTEQDVFFGPVINERAVKTFEGAVECRQKRRQNPSRRQTHQGRSFRQGPFRRAHDRRASARPRAFFARALRALPLGRQGRSRSIRRSPNRNKAEYGLTAGIFTAKKEEIERFFDEIESGVCYANRPTGATTGRLARRPVLLRLEGLRLDRQGRLRALLRRAVHARAKPHDHGIMAARSSKVEARRSKARPSTFHIPPSTC